MSHQLSLAFKWCSTTVAGTLHYTLFLLPFPACGWWHVLLSWVLYATADNALNRCQWFQLAVGWRINGHVRIQTRVTRCKGELAIHVWFRPYTKLTWNIVLFMPLYQSYRIISHLAISSEHSVGTFRAHIFSITCQMLDTEKTEF